MRPSGMVWPRDRASSSVSGPVRIDPGATAFTRMRVWREIQRRGAGEGFDPALGRVVGDVAAVGSGGATAGHADDAAALAAGHQPRGPVRAQEDSLEVGVQHAVPPRLVALQKVARLVGQPGIVDQHVHVAEVFERGVEEAVHLWLLGHIRHHAEGFAARLSDGLGNLFNMRADVVGDDAGALLAEALGDRPADATPGPGDEYDGCREASLLLHRPTVLGERFSWAREGSACAHRRHHPLQDVLQD